MATSANTLTRITRCTALALLLGTAPPLAAQASPSVLYVTNNAVHNGAGCGSQARPCRSISRAIANADSGGLIEVGPGIYGDIDGNGDTDSAVDEPSIVIDKSLTIYSTRGAGQTIIRVPRRPDLRTIVVLIHVDGTT